MSISHHAVTRFCERTGCKSRRKARATIRRLAGRARPAAMARTGGGKPRLLPAELLADNGWVFVVKGDCVVTCYFGVGKDEVLPMPEREVAAA